MKYVVESGRYDKALRKCFSKRIIKESASTYAKAEKLLDCPEMEPSHAFLYDLDLENVSNEDAEKINKLYDLAVKNNLIDDYNNSKDDYDDIDDDAEVSDNTEDDKPTPIVPTDVPDNFEREESDNPTNSSYICLYSAVRNGKITTGECYTNAFDPEGAKAQAIVKLTACGLKSIDIIAVEMGNPDMKGVDKPFEEVNNSLKDDITVNDQTINTNIDLDKYNLNNEQGTQELKEAVGDAPDDSSAGTSEKPEEPSEEPPEEPSEEPDETPEEPEEDDDDDDDEEPKDDKKELSNQEKTELKNKLTIAIHNTLKDMHIESCEDMNLEQYGDFWSRLAKKWGTDNPDVKEFLSDDEIEDIDHIRVKMT